ncbi:SAV_6107 family HEPN domain-containing protein [Corynebacterium aquatimens]|uniref:SAV-6107-like HEPN domain-containing protein n=1 Tax=Corynebacterium aquatimens TaxID=1190508 RepID=A0A931DUY5_9CORY|nr:SAV_6107 family HEPN domain-containing protein [Corynebacterium aquatimens]MBG6121974.1 hypothetical protein [Corynebacterium aquatimens]
MGNVVSATTRAAYGKSDNAGKRSQRESFLTAAADLLDSAHIHLGKEAYDLALEYGYQAALRTAGAEISSSPALAKRKRLPSSAWEKLSLTGVRGKYWASELGKFSRVRGRVASGIELHPEPITVARLVALADEFYTEVSLGATETGLAA